MSTQKHMLITRLSAMGDVAMVMPVVYAFAKAYPDIKISFLSKPFHSAIVETLPNVHFIPAETNSKHKGILGLWKLSRIIKEQHITHIVDVHNVLRTKILTRFITIPYARIDKGRGEKKTLIEAKGNKITPLKTTVERYVEVFEKLGFSTITPRVLPVPKKNEAVAVFTKGCSRKWLGIAPFAAHQGKQYPLDLMQEVLEKLDNTGSFDIFLFGAPDEVGTLRDLAQNSKNTKIVATKLTFSEEINLISQLDGMLSMDSGNGHLAAMFGVPTITLWGVTHPYAGFAPFGQEQHCILSDRKTHPLIPTSIYGNVVPQGYEDVMKTIAPQVVVQKIIDIVQ